MSESAERVFHLEKKSLKRVLGAGDLFAIGYGDVGSSIYYALGLTAFYALGATPIALAIAGFVFICTAFTYAEMSTTFPEAGGSATYSRYAFNDLISFIAGWGLLLDYILTIAISAFAIPPYLKYIFELVSIPFPSSVISQTIMTIGIIGFLYILNLVGVKHSGRFSLMLAVITILSQIFILLAGGILLLNLPYVISHMKVNVAGADWSPDWWEFMKGTAMAMVAYTGIESIAQLSSETKKASVMIPRAIKGTMVLLVMVYFGISVVGLSVISPQELGTTYINDPIAGIVVNFPFGGAWLAPWFGLIAAIILLIASNAGLLGCSRLMFSMGEYYQVPHMFYKMHARFRTPYLSLGVFAVLACLIVVISNGEMLFLADLYNFGAQIAFFSAHLSLIVLRLKRPTLHRPYKAPFNIPFGKKRSIPITALIGALASFSVWILVVVTKPDGRNLGLIWLAIGICMYLFYRRKKELPAMGQVSIEKVKIPEYNRMKLKHVLVTARSKGTTEGLQTACQLARDFHASVTSVYIIEIPQSIPLDAKMVKREMIGEAALKRAEAVAREYHLSIDLKLVRARSIYEAVLDLVETDHYDLIVITASEEDLQTRNNFANQAHKLIKEAPCRVLFCKA